MSKQIMMYRVEEDTPEGLYKFLNQIERAKEPCVFLKEETEYCVVPKADVVLEPILTMGYVEGYRQMTVEELADSIRAAIDSLGAAGWRETG